jgi:hypothetical protein
MLVCARPAVFEPISLADALSASGQLAHETVLIFEVCGIYDKDLPMPAIHSDGLVYRSPNFESYPSGHAAGCRTGLGKIESKDRKMLISLPESFF